MLTSGSLLQPRLQVEDAGVVGVAARPRAWQPDPVAVGLDRPHPGFEGPRLRRLAAGGGRGLEHAPVVEDPRHVDDGAGALGHLQHQVPVLGALELGVEAADLLDQGPAQDAEVAGVHLRPHPLRRPVGLEEGAGVAAGGGRSCPRRCRRSRPRGCASSASATWARASGCSRSSWSSRATNSPVGHRQRVVGGGDDAAVLLPVGDPDARVAAAAPRRGSRARAAAGSRRRPGTAPSRRSSGARPSAASCAGRRPASRRPG